MRSSTNKKTLAKSLFYAFFVCLAFSLKAQKLSKEQSRADLLQLKEAIQVYNPALESYNPDFGANADNLIASITDSIPQLQHFAYVSQLCAFSNEGHFTVGMWTDRIHAGFIDNIYHYLPVSVKVWAGRMYVWIDNSKEQSLNRGNEILEINGLKTEAVLSLIRNALPTDGDIKTYADRNIELGFSWMYYLYVEQPDTFSFKLRDSSGEKRQVAIQAIDRDSQFDNYDKYYPNHNTDAEPEPFYALNHAGEIAYLTLPSFDYRAVKRNEIKSKKFYKTIFTELKEEQTKYLVVDLRGNTGGRNEFADDMVPYIIKSGNSASFLKKTISWKSKKKTYKFPKPSKLAFPGKVYVLVNGRTYSAGSTLSRYFKEYADAVIIGEETGTRYEGFSAGSKQFVTLTNSHLRIGIPRYHILFPESSKQTTSNRGLLADHKVEYTITDLMQDNDLHMIKVNSLIEQNKVMR